MVCTSTARILGGGNGSCGPGTICGPRGGIPLDLTATAAVHTAVPQADLVKFKSFKSVVLCKQSSIAKRPNRNQISSFVQSTHFWSLLFYSQVSSSRQAYTDDVIENTNTHTQHTGWTASSHGQNTASKPTVEIVSRKGQFLQSLQLVELLRERAYRINYCRRRRQGRHGGQQRSTYAVIFGNASVHK